jgi:hypothetical protein
VEYFWIYGNIIDNSVELIALYGTGGLPRNFVIHSNVIIGRYAETGYGDAGFLVKSLSYGYFFHNTFVDPQGGGPFLHAIRLENDGSGYGTNHCCIKNNIYYSASTASIMRFDSGMLANHEVDYNHYYTASATPFRYDYPTSPGEEDYTTWKMHGYDSHSAANVTTDPKFVSVVGEDFHLQTSSPCIDTGTDLSRYFTLDKDRKPRARTGWDKGAYEFGSGAPPPLPPVGLRIVQ